jgi:hypothetical protein
VIPPKFLSLPILSSFDLVFDLLLILEVLLTNGHSRALESILENILTLGHDLVTFELPEDCSAIISATRKKGPDDIPSDTIYGLLMIC